MSYGRTVPTVYAVYFEDVRVLKVGLSSIQRWKNFVARGARVVALEEFDSAVEARIFERRNHEYLASIRERGFSSRAEANPFIGIGGHGWTETYLLNSGDDPMEILRNLPIAEGVAA